MKLFFDNTNPFILIAGPCQIESRQHAFETAEALIEICRSKGVPFVYKSSFDKANRTSIYSQRGVGMRAGLDILADVRENFGCFTTTDVHTSIQCDYVPVDIIQIPALLSKQTDLLLAAGKTGKIVNIKKGQFMAPNDAMHAAHKVQGVTTSQVVVTERGTSFGYNNLVVDMRSLPILAQGVPVIFDATHSVQLPGGDDYASGGDRRFAPVLARAALAIGIAGLFMECHPDPDNAPSDGPNMVRISDLSDMLDTFIEIDQIAKRNPIRI